MKTCTVCHITQDETYFSIAARNVGGKMHSCKNCNKRFRIERGYEQKRASRPEHAEYNARRFKKYAQSTRGRAIYLYNGAKKRALDKNLEFDLTVEYIEQFLIIGICFKTLFRFDLKPRGRSVRNAFAPSVDRIDNNRGYTMDNVQVVCDMYNHGKGQHTDEEFIRFCNRVAKVNPRECE